MKKALITSIIVGTIFICITIYYGVKEYNTNDLLQNYEKVERERLYQQLRNKELINLTALETDGIIFLPTMTDSTNKKGLDVALYETPKLLYYYSELNCNSCVEIIIKEIESFRNKIGTNSVIYLSDYKRDRDMKIFKRINQIKSEIYNVKSLNIPIEKVRLPTIFIVDGDKRIRSTYIPLKEDVNSFKTYLKNIETKYFNKKMNNNELVLDQEKQSSNFHTSVDLVSDIIKLGKISSKTTQKATFHLKNNGKQPLVINAVNTTCDCTVATYDKMPVPPGKNASIVLEYSPNSLGYFSKSADVVCNVPEGFVRLTISGEVIEK